jgi:uncharacterized membrane protein YdjX (TVP38/TMEM64 family)
MAENCSQAAPVPARSSYIAIGVVVVAMVLLWLFGRPHLAQLHAQAGEFHAGIVILALFTLPLVGIPVSVLHALTGAKFGWPVGMALVAASIAFQLVVSYLIVRAAPHFFKRRFAWLHDRLPKAAHRSLTLFVMLLPGAPYFAQNYVLAGAGIPFRMYFAYAFGIHLARSVVGVIFGEWSGDLTPARGAVFAVYTVGITLACGLAFRRLRAQWRNQR